MTDEMKGMTMIASTMPAVSMPMPSGGPVKSGPMIGHLPRFASSQGLTYSPMIGTNTNRPHMP